MTRRIGNLAIVLAFLLVVLIAPGDEPPAAPASPEPPAVREGLSAHTLRGWDFDPQAVEAAITPDLVRALCPPYSVLEFYEDGSYTCSPG